MIRQRLASTLVVAAAGLISAACASLGPEAKVTMAQDELNQTKSVGKVFVATPFGASDESGTLDKVVAATAIKAYGARSVPATIINSILSTSGAPDGLANALVAPYAGKFAEAVKTYDPKDQTTRPTAMSLPSGDLPGFDMPKKFDQESLKNLISKIKVEAEAAKSVANTMRSGNTEGMIQALGASKQLSPLLVLATQALMSSADVDHILLTHVTGNEADYNGGKNVRMVAALVNIKTGKFRFFGEIEGKQAMGIPYALFLGNIANKLFDAGTENDPALASSPGEEGKSSENSAPIKGESYESEKNADAGKS